MNDTNAISNKNTVPDIKQKSKILCVDDSESIRFLIETILDEYFTVEFEFNPVNALMKIDESYDCILLDLMMPLLSGIEILKEIRKNPKLSSLPVIVLTAKNCNEKEIADLFAIGANDYVTKPFLSAELIARVKHQIKLKSTTEELIKTNDILYKAVKKEELLNEKIIEKTIQLKRSNKRIVTLNKRLRYLATHDKLTKFYNRRAFYIFLENDIKRLKRINTKLSLLMIDIDYFKNINDTYGHLTGDMVLRSLSDIIRSTLREIDIAGRYGGEEFLILLPDSDAKGAKIAAEKLRKQVEKSVIDPDNLKIKLTISIGIAEFIANEDLDSLIARVDKALYVAKNSGRNVTVVAE